MKLKVEKPKIIEDGVHLGVIADVQYRTEPFSYTDLIIEFDGGIQLKAGYPTKVMEQSKLGLLLKRFGIIVADGLEVDPDVLKGKGCSFVTIQEVTDRGSFAHIVADSVKPANTVQAEVQMLNKAAEEQLGK